MAVTVSLIGVAMREEINKEEGNYTHVRIYNGADHTFSVQFLSYFVNCVASDCRIKSFLGFVFYWYLFTMV